MASLALVIGRSGSGKSASLENLPEKETFVVNVASKDMPWKGWRKKFNAENKNYMETDSTVTITKFLAEVDKKLPHVNKIVIDDFQYLMGHYYMRKAMESGWDVFKQMGQDIFNLIWQAKLCKKDTIIYFLSHDEKSDDGRVKCKTSGKMLDQHITLEGEFTIVLVCDNDGTKYWFETKSNGLTPAKSPKGMFQDRIIDNDLNVVSNAIKTYYEGE
jgi:adenosyl cobinamide kinase/adenosyl cobinamide phosphate guanylyltransferase